MSRVSAFTASACASCRQPAFTRRAGVLEALGMDILNAKML
jgi:hypothetical protein